MPRRTQPVVHWRSGECRQPTPAGLRGFDLPISTRSHGGRWQRSKPASHHESDKSRRIDRAGARCHRGSDCEESMKVGFDSQIYFCGQRVPFTGRTTPVAIELGFTPSTPARAHPVCLRGPGQGPYLEIVYNRCEKAWPFSDPPDTGFPRGLDGPISRPILPIQNDLSIVTCRRSVALACERVATGGCFWRFFKHPCTSVRGPRLAVRCPLAFVGSLRSCRHVSGDRL